MGVGASTISSSGASPSSPSSLSPTTAVAAAAAAAASLPFSCQILSDVHLEFGGTWPTFPPKASPARAQHLALLGDIGLLSSVAYVAQYRDFLAFCCAEYSGGFVFLIFGNHEYWQLDLVTAAQQMRAMKAGDAARLSNLVFLDCDAFDVPGTDVRVLGCTLWSEPAPGADRMMNDFRFIKGMTLAAYRDTHRRHVAWLEQECARAAADGKRVVVLTHHAPIVSGLVPQVAQGKALTEAGCLGTDLLSAPGSRFHNTKTVKFWGFGHTHLSLRMQVGSCVVLSNQYGYPGDHSKQWWFGAVAGPFSAYTTYDPGCQIRL